MCLVNALYAEQRRKKRHNILSIFIFLEYWGNKIELDLNFILFYFILFLMC